MQAAPINIVRLSLTDVYMCVIMIIITRLCSESAKAKISTKSDPGFLD